MRVPHLAARALALVVPAAAALAAVLAAAESARAADPPSEETILYFKQNCTSCHTIGGGRLAGPDLKDVTTRRTRDQLVKYVQDPKGAIDAGDPYLVQLWNDAKGVYMPQPPGITAERIGKLLDLIEAESALEKSQFAGTAVSDRPLNDADLARGRRLFEGGEAFVNGAPPCFSCHSVEGVPGFGGGRLGPDLTGVFSRLGGRKSLAAWLTAPQSVTMGPAFRGRDLNELEILGLVAFLKDRSESFPDAAAATGPAPARGAGVFEYLAAGVGGLLAALALFDFFWRGRFRSVRRALVERSRREGAGRAGEARQPKGWERRADPPHGRNISAWRADSAESQSGAEGVR